MLSINSLQKIKKPLLPLAMTTLLTIGCTATINAQNRTINSSSTPTIKISTIDNYIQYRNLHGKLVNIGIVDKATVSLYEAVQKHSSNCTTDIVDIGGFYADVESNIPKNEVGIDKNMMKQESDVENINRNLKKLITTQRHTQCSQLFNKLFEIFTSTSSEKGAIITVNEYTKMMEAWSSTGNDITVNI